ncbi:MAG: hypothetical protein ACTHWQ_09150, partial [Sphingobacterium sp.]
MILEKRIQAFVLLGQYLGSREFLNTSFLDQVEQKNPWYTRENVQKQLQVIAINLKEEKLRCWLQ